MVSKKSPDWLPAGWTAQYKVQKNGHKVRYYTNSETGQKFYSKNDVIRYVKMGNIRRDAPQPINRHINRRSGNKHMQLVAKTNKFPEWLPNGWIVETKTRKSGSRMGTQYKCYIDPLTGCRFYSKPEVSRYLKTVKRNGYTSKRKKIGTGMRSASNVPRKLKNIKRNSCTSKQKKIGIGMPATNVVVEKVAPNGLPPGWILEIKIKKNTNGTRRDPYYTDPVSGYVFRSRKDVLRYLETGEISRHAFKPKKRAINDLESINNEISPPSAAKRQKLTHRATRRQLFAGKGSSDMSSLALPEAEGSRKRRGKMVSAETRHSEILQEKHSPENVTEKCAETRASSDPSSSAQPKARGSERKRGEKVFDENGPVSVSTPAADILQEKKLPENGIGKHSGRKIQISSIKSKKKKEFNLPCRASKRLAGLEPELVAHSGSIERALRVAARKSGESEAIPALGVVLDSVAHRASQQIGAEPETELPHNAIRGMEAPLDEEPSNKSKKPLEDQAVPVEQPGNLEPEKKDEKKTEPQLFYGDFWSDPCLEFAFKTLTGAIPVEDNLEIQGYFQQQLDTSPVQKDGGLTLPDFGLPSIFQSDISSHFDAPEKPVSKQQLPVPLNPSFLPPGNVSLPSCSGNDPQQPSLEGNKNSQRKEVH